MVEHYACTEDVIIYTNQMGEGGVQHHTQPLLTQSQCLVLKSDIYTNTLYQNTEDMPGFYTKFIKCHRILNCFSSTYCEFLMLWLYLHFSVSLCITPSDHRNKTFKSSIPSLYTSVGISTDTFATIRKDNNTMTLISNKYCTRIFIIPAVYIFPNL